MKNIVLHIIAMFLVMTMSSNDCYSQEVKVDGRIEKDSVFTGQPFEYQLDIIIPDGYVVDWSNLKDSLSENVEILSRGDILEERLDNSDILLSQKLTLATFDTGYVEIPGIPVKYLKSAKDTTSYVNRTDFMYIYVQSASIDTTMTYRAIKSPIRQNITFKETIPYLLGIVIVIFLILIVVHLIKRSKAKEKVEKEEVIPQIPAITIARERLLQLKDASLWQSGRYKDYYTDLTDITREYLDGEFNIDAIEMTSEEILQEVKRINLDSQIFNKLQETLSTADLVKFAKATPGRTENENAFVNINSFIEESYQFHQELERKMAEEAKSKKRDAEESTENQEMEETK